MCLKFGKSATLFGKSATLFGKSATLFGKSATLFQLYSAYSANSGAEIKRKTNCLDIPGKGKQTVWIS